MANYFADCSGDSILAPLTGAEFKVGREAKSEFNEEFGLEVADNHTMGMSIMIQCRETDHPVSYTPPAWAYDFPDDDAMNNKPHKCLTHPYTNFYWIELGGEYDSIHDTEMLRDELLKTAYGIWDHIKNRGDHGAENWELEWVSFLPGKRESRRYIGDYILTQHDVENHPHFDDTVAYGGWQIDNHLPGGFAMTGKGMHLQKRRLSEPYGIPYRCLYSKNIDNLMFAGRNISATHIGFSTTRVMGTVGLLGQAADRVLLMTYEWGYTYGPPMAVAPLPNVRAVLDYAVTEIPSEKIFLGIPNYGYDWPLPFVQGTTRAQSISNQRAIELAIQHNIAILHLSYGNHRIFCEVLS